LNVPHNALSHWSRTSHIFVCFPEIEARSFHGPPSCDYFALKSPFVIQPWLHRTRCSSSTRLHCRKMEALMRCPRDGKKRLRRTTDCFPHFGPSMRLGCLFDNHFSLKRKRSVFAVEVTNGFQTFSPIFAMGHQCKQFESHVPDPLQSILAASLRSAILCDACVDLLEHFGGECDVW
jgi:hypothetical protein